MGPRLGVAQVSWQVSRWCPHDYEDENPFANFKASSSASSSAWLPRRNDILGLDPQLSLAAAAEEAEKKAEKRAELEAAKKEKISASMMIYGDTP